ncbi:Hypothetical predicted protein [Pelobates cultripes]|uniref:Uncharacterized protein n=1 Tax=Pelobates cultripes TaxID=61616 RepID=A0AAD1S0S9_PELCU|nr:Hypothetical predicted protein [Pelobates cultripes]
MDEFLQTLAATREEAGGPKMAPATISPDKYPASTLEGIGEEIRTMAALMATKTDLLVLTTTIQDALRAEMAGIRTEVASQGNRLQELEHSHAAQTARLATTDTALTRQGDLLLQLRRLVEDLDNRGRRCNIRVRGLPETEGEEDIEETLTALFRLIVPGDAQLDIRGLNIPECRSHLLRVLRRKREGPRDIICCIHSFSTKDAIMKAARSRPTWDFRGAQISLFNDLSSVTLEARRALRPITTLLRDHNIPYKWGFPFALLARHQNGDTLNMSNPPSIQDAKLGTMRRRRSMKYLDLKSFSIMERVCLCMCLSCSLRGAAADVEKRGDKRSKVFHLLPARPYKNGTIGVDFNTWPDDTRTMQRKLSLIIISEIGRAGLHTSLHELEHSHAAQTARLATTDTALTRQGDLLLQLRRLVEDLDNRGRRCNIRVRGLPETEGEEDIEETLTALFRLIVPGDAQLDIRGLNIPECRSHLLRVLRRKRVSIAMLQETHFKEGAAPKIRSTYHPIGYCLPDRLRKAQGT